MNKHIIHKDMAAYIAETLRPEDRGRIEQHIRECGSCADKHNKLLAAMAPRAQFLKAEEYLRERILRSWQQIRNEEAGQKQVDIRSVIRKYPRVTVASAFAAVAAIAIVVIVFVQAPVPTHKVSMVVSQADAGVTINGIEARQGKSAGGGARIKVPDKALTKLVYEDMINITLVNRSNFLINSFIIEKNSTVKIKGDLENGLLISSVQGRTAWISCEYATPNVRIEPLGTVFLLQAAGGLTLVIVQEGSVKASLLRGGKSEVLHSGSKCVISDSFKILPMTKEDINMFNDPEMLRKGAFARLLLPAVHAPNVPINAGARDRGDGGKKTAAVQKADGQNNSEGVTGENIRRERDREQDREHRRQILENRKMQMNEMRRNDRTNMIQQRRRGK